MSDSVGSGRADLSGVARLAVCMQRARPSRRRYRAAAGASTAVLAMALVAGCGSGSPSAPAPSPAASSATATNDAASSASASASVAANTLEIGNFLFVPETLTVPAGAVVTVDNQDGANHTVTAIDGSFDTGNIAGHGHATFTAPTKPGSYPYKCAIHPFMTGMVTVTG